MKILWLGWEDSHTPARVRAASEQRGLDVTIAQVADLRFVADSASRRVGVMLGDLDVVRCFDVLVVRVFYPRISEALTVVSLFHQAGKLVIDESLTDEGVTLSKMHDYLILAQAGLPVPRTWHIADLSQVEALAESLGYPFVLKGIHGSYGAHVHRIDTVEQLREVWARYRPGELMAQEYLPAESDFRVICIGYRALPALVERAPKPGDFRTNSRQGGQAVGHPLTAYPDLALLAEKAARVLRREFAAVDLRYRGTEPLVLEVNRRPMFENFERATGLDVAGAFLDYVRRCYEAFTPVASPAMAVQSTPMVTV
ncbi:MAG: ATP-grasp domain-containing protein [Candidatus Roseilinea sp.]|uniref:ATP-grasp domain-containing protein n=1 Tax=Candidatus Roseilinea sp. TaxID=2838777 RepID=UPI004049D9A9